MGRFSRIKEAKITQRNEYVPEGEHLLKCLSIKTDKAFAGYEYFLSELEVVETDNPKLKPGKTVTYFVKMENGKPWESNIKAFLVALNDENEEDFDEADVEAALSTKNPCEGKLVRCTGTPTITKSGKPFVRMNWQPHEVEAAS